MATNKEIKKYKKLRRRLNRKKFRRKIIKFFIQKLTIIL